MNLRFRGYCSRVDSFLGAGYLVEATEEIKHLISVIKLLQAYNIQGSPSFHPHKIIVN